MRSRTGGRVTWIGSAAVVLLVAAWPPAHAATSIVAPDGAVHTVWEVRTQSLPDSGTPGLWHLAYSVEYPGGAARAGTIAPTDDAVQDSSPRLALDPVTRKPVLVWSRHDGTALQIAYARYEAADWTDVHYLTFAPAGKTLPRLGTSRDGSFLFFLEDARRYLYAPLDLSRGRLYAAPKAISNGTLRKGDGAALPRVATGQDSSPAILDPGGAVVQGNQDTPVIINCRKGEPCQNADVWLVGSRDTCGAQVLLIPDGDRDLAYVVRFENGSAEFLRRVPLPAPIPEDFGTATVTSFLDALCPALQ